MRFHERCQPRVDIDKEMGGASWYISMGIAGSSSWKHVGGLSREQAEVLSDIIREVGKSAVMSAQAAACEALGVGANIRP